jgi:hypothetical protein
MMAAATPALDEAAATSRAHLRFGLWTLLGFLTLGIALETLHGFKVGWYLDATNETRRLMFTLAHTHGTLLSLVHVVFGLLQGHLRGWRRGTRQLASRSLVGAVLLLPVGFLLGGFFIRGGDPGLGIVLVPPGALLLLVGVFLTARAASAPDAGPRG